MQKDDLVYVGHMLDMACLAVSVDYDIVWNVTTVNLPPLVEELKKLVPPEDAEAAE